MKVIDILTAPWAVLPEMYREMLAIYDRWFRGEQPDIAVIEAAIGKPLKNEQQRYTVTPEGVAVIPVQGVIGKKMNMFSEISGGASTQVIAADFREALGRADVKAIMLDVDSPGGAVDGTLELAREIFEARGRKPIAAFGDGLMASAAMWIGAAADEVFLSADTAQAGSIGVVTTHTEVSEAEKRAGIKTTIITAGKYKALGNRYEPLGDEARGMIQERLDYVYSLFVNDIAAFRGTDPETVLEKMADGKIFFGEQAVKAGLVDGIMSREQVIRVLVERADRGVNQPGVNARINGGAAMDLETLRAQHPELVNALITEGKTAGLAEGKALGIEEGRKLGADAERERIQAVKAQGMRGHEALIEGLMFDGKTTGPEAAVKVLAAEKATRETVLATIQAEAPEPVKPSAPEPKEQALTEQQRTVNALLGVSEEEYRKHAAK